MEERTICVTQMDPAISKERKKVRRHPDPRLLEGRDRHGYEIGRLITERSEGALTYHVASLYPTLYRLEDHGLVEGRWVEKAGQRRRRYYRLTTAGRKRLSIERSVWQDFFVALDRVAGLQRS